MKAPIDVNNSPVAWRETGDGDVVMFLHGLGGSRTAWEPQLRDLSDHWRCIAWDLPGYGESRPFSGPMTWKKAAAAVVSVLDAVAAQKAPVVGMSLGGMVALHTALEYPDRVGSLVLISSSPAFGLDGVTKADDWKAQRLEPLEQGARMADLAPRILRAIAGPQASTEVIEEAVAAMQRIPASGFRAAVECLPSHDVRERLADIQAPTLVLVGEQDEETPPSYSRYLADNIPRSLLEIVPEAGHLLNLERPDAVNASIRRFLEQEDFT
ncbi:MAG: alpha/beta fold hydrolase [Acidimicrobiia bacterium]